MRRVALIALTALTALIALTAPALAQATSPGSFDPWAEAPARPIHAS
jgi:hypothetical protein